MNSEHRFISKFSVFTGLIVYSLLLILPVGGCTQQTFRQMADEMAGDKIPVVYPSDLPASYVMLDAREVEEYRVSHISGAKYIGFDHFDISNCSIPKDQTIIIYCSVGYRSGKIAEKLKSEGYKNVYNLWGGIFNWVNSGKEVVNDEGPTTKVHPFDETWGRWLTRGEKAYE